VLDVTLTLLRKHPSDQQLWKQMQTALHTMARLNTTLLSYARGSVLAPALVDLGALARDTVGVLARVVPPEIAIHFDIAEDPPPIRGVRSELEQLVLNLVINACEAMPKGGDLTIAVRKSARAVLVLEVTDTGTGIATPGINGKSTKRHGAGLGLGIVQAVVDKHRGAVNIAPVEGGGTKVTVMLPTTRSR